MPTLTVSSSTPVQIPEDHPRAAPGLAPEPALETSTASTTARVMKCGDLDLEHPRSLLGRFGLEVRWVSAGEPIPGSYWGAPEAGLQGRVVWIRHDTPVHSFLHESCHAICMDEPRRQVLDTDAGGEEMEENGVCYLQILLADHLPGVGRKRLMADMDLWGYSFRLGSTRAWFENDAEDARIWLEEQGLIDAQGVPHWRLRD